MQHIAQLPLFFLLSQVRAWAVSIVWGWVGVMVCASPPLFHLAFFQHLLFEVSGLSAIVRCILCTMPGRRESSAREMPVWFLLVGYTLHVCVCVGGGRMCVPVNLCFLYMAEGRNPSSGSWSQR